MTNDVVSGLTALAASEGGDVARAALATGAGVGRTLVSETQVKGQMAMWAVRQHPYNKPPRLDEVTQQIEDACAKWTDVSIGDFRCQYFNGPWDLVKWLESVFPKDHEIMVQWNSRANGSAAPFSFSSRFSSPAKDDDFIDIDALLRNVALGCIRESEREDCPSSESETAPSQEPSASASDSIPPSQSRISGS